MNQIISGFDIQEESEPLIWPKATVLLLGSWVQGLSNEGYNEALDAQGLGFC